MCAVSFWSLLQSPASKHIKFKFWIWLQAHVNARTHAHIYSYIVIYLVYFCLIQFISTTIKNHANMYLTILCNNYVWYLKYVVHVLRCCESIRSKCLEFLFNFKLLLKYLADFVETLLSTDHCKTARVVYIAYKATVSDRMR